MYVTRCKQILRSPTAAKSKYFFFSVNVMSKMIKQNICFQDCGCYCEKLQGQSNFPKPCEKFPKKSRIGKKKNFFFIARFLTFLLIIIQKKSSLCLQKLKVENTIWKKVSFIVILKELKNFQKLCYSQ